MLHAEPSVLEYESRITYAIYLAPTKVSDISTSNTDIQALCSERCRDWNERFKDLSDNDGSGSGYSESELCLCQVNR